MISAPIKSGAHAKRFTRVSLALPLAVQTRGDPGDVGHERDGEGYVHGPESTPGTEGALWPTS
jgi:hypothetical protein